MKEYNFFHKFIDQFDFKFLTEDSNSLTNFTLENVFQNVRILNQLNFPILQLLWNNFFWNFTATWRNVAPLGDKCHHVVLFGLKRKNPISPQSAAFRNNLKTKN